MKRDNRRFAGGPSFDIQPAYSHSQTEQLRRCRRKWALGSGFTRRYFGPRVADVAEVEAMLMEDNLLVGQVVDATIDKVMRTYKETGTLEADIPGAGVTMLQHFRRYSRNWVNSVRQRSEIEPDEFAQPIDRIYRENDFTAEEGRVIVQTVKACLANLQNSEVWAHVLTLPREQIYPKSVAIPWFLTDGVPVYAAYDLLTMSPDRTLIIDWKTGLWSDKKERRARIQLGIYACYVMVKYQIPAEQIGMYAIWLGEDGRATPYTVPTDYLEQVTPGWKDHWLRLRADVERIKADPSLLDELFPMTDKPEWYCDGCRFWSCEGRRRLEAVTALDGQAEDEWDD